MHESAQHHRSRLLTQDRRFLHHRHHDEAQAQGLNYRRRLDLLRRVLGPGGYESVHVFPRYSSRRDEVYLLQEGA